MGPPSWVVCSAGRGFDHELELNRTWFSTRLFQLRQLARLSNWHDC